MNIINSLKYVTDNKYSAFFYTPPLIDNAVSVLFKNPFINIKCSDPSGIKKIFLEADKYIKESTLGFCLIPYETGYLFEEILKKKLHNNYSIPLADFYFYNSDETCIQPSTELNLEEYSDYYRDNPYNIENFNLNTEESEYIRSINSIKNYIESGDTYQVNFTVKGKYNLKGDIISLFYTLIYNQSASYTAFINLGDKIIISISPELFFEISNNNITAKPMKGTIPRGANIEADIINQDALRNDVKNQAENVMIVDLLRNDLGKICSYDSVKTKSLFDIERYETLFQMTSTVVGKLNQVNLHDIICNIFPCGSITGAPKIRTMEIIKELEKEERGYYTGTIGLFLKEKKTFNIPIRTTIIDPLTKEGEIGIGSGIVWDSVPHEEYQETVLKASFLSNALKPFELFETTLAENNEIFLEECHIERLKRTADYFLFKFDMNEINRKLNNVKQLLENNKSYKIKLSLNKWGAVKVYCDEYLPAAKEIDVVISDIKMNSGNKFLYFKTTNRSTYDYERSEAEKKNFHEVIYFNEKDELTEGSFTNIFLKKNSTWLTPPVSAGILKGCYRQFLLTKENHSVKRLHINDLIEADSMKCVNSLRKEMWVKNIYYRGKIIKAF